MLNIVTKPKTFLSKGSIGYRQSFLQPGLSPSISYTLKDKKTFLNASLYSYFGKNESKSNSLATKGEEFIFERNKEGDNQSRYTGGNIDYFRSLGKGWELNARAWLFTNKFLGENKSSFRQGNDSTIHFQSNSLTNMPMKYGSLEIVKTFSKKSKLHLTTKKNDQDYEQEYKNLFTSKTTSKGKNLYLQALHSLQLKKISRLEYGVLC